MAFPPALQTCLAPRGWASVPQPRAVWGRTKNPFSAAVGTSVRSAQPEPSLPLGPALLNGYKLEDKSAAFQEILPSISANCRFPSYCAGMEEERRKARSLLGPCPAANKHTKGVFLLGSNRWEQRPAEPQGRSSHLCRRRPRRQLLFIEHLLCAGLFAGQRAGASAGPFPRGLRTVGGPGGGWPGSSAGGTGSLSVEVTLHPFIPQTSTEPSGGSPERWQRPSLRLKEGPAGEGGRGAVMFQGLEAKVRSVALLLRTIRHPESEP